MQYFRYLGCQDHLQGKACIITGEFDSTHQDSDFRPWVHPRTTGHINRETKYEVTFEFGDKVNVYGRNLRKCDDQRWADEGSYYTHPKRREVYPYVIVRFLEGRSLSKNYYYKNAHVVLTERDLVVVQANGTYKTAKVWGCHRDDEYDPRFAGAHKYVACRIDLEQMERIEEKDKRLREINKEISDRLRHLKDALEVSDFMHDPELAHLITEKNELEE